MYPKLKHAVKSGKLKIFFLVSPPRSSSTALERAISQSPSIDLQINDPWAIYETDDKEEQTYNYIWSRINPLLLSQETITLLIKNVADYIPPGDFWKRQQQLVAHTIFLIRNPFLSLESLIKIEMNPSPEILRTGDYRSLEEPLKNKFLDCRTTGWEALWEHAEVMGQKPYTVVDSTLYRAFPELVFPYLTKKMEINFDEGSTNWTKNKKKFETDYDGAIPYYERVIKSDNLEPPLEEPLELEKFPFFLQEHLMKPGGALAIYLRFIKIMLAQMPELNASNLINTSLNGKSLQNIDPIFAYILLLSFNETNPNFEFQKELEYIAKAHPQFKKVFYSINLI